MNPAAPAGVPPDERIASIDVLRGIALFGVMAVNVVNEFRVSIFQQILPASIPPALFDRLAETFVSQALELKAFALFSLLFGVGLAIQFERLSTGGRTMYLLSRRLGVLLVFGLIHLLFIWNGDILTQYAIAGFLVLPLLRAPAWMLGAALAGTLIVYVAMPVKGLPIPLPDPAMVERHLVEANRLYATGGFGEIWRLSLGELPMLLPLHVLVFPRTVGLFLVGVLAWRSGLFRTVGRFRGQVVFGAVVSITIGAAMTVAGGAAERLGTCVLAIGYALAVLGLVQFPPGRVLRVFASIGRMAFTNYVMQSILFGTIFFGWGLGMYGRLGAAQALLIGVIVYVGQMIFSVWWLRRFRYGPLEWIWRTLMYGKSQRMSREIAPSAQR